MEKYKLFDQASEIVEEINFLLKHRPEYTNALMVLKKAMFTLNGKNISIELKNHYISKLEEWQPDDICLSALNFSVQAYIYSITK